MIITELNIRCIWDGTLTGILIKNAIPTTGIFGQTTTKIIGIHGWLDNLNSLLPLAKKLIERHPDYEIYLYDRAGHGFSSHLSEGSDYSATQNLQDLRTVIRTLGWNQEKFSIIGHSYGALLSMMYAASYPEEVLCVVAIDALIRGDASPKSFWTSIGSRIDTNLDHLNHLSKAYTRELTFEKAIDVIKSSRPGLTDETAKLLTERSIRRDADNKLHFTRDESLKLLSLFPFTIAMVEHAVRSIKAPILYIGTANSQYRKPYKTIDLLKQYHPHFEMTLIDGPHHLHMTHVDEVVTCIERYFNKYLQQSSTSVIERSKL